jgi:ATP-dependent helicase/nuclease subunit A
MALTELSQEKRAILDSDASGVVSAGAGSGKTTLLARAVFEDVTARGIPLERILVVAFNNAAAAHLVGRIQAEFVDGRDTSEPAMDLSSAWVGTFHALCGRIVRERAHAAGVAPDLVVLDELESRMLLEHALDAGAESCDHPGLVPMLGAFTDPRAAARSVLDRGRAAGNARPDVPVPAAAVFDPAPLRRAAEAVLATPGMSAARCRKAEITLASAGAGADLGMSKIGANVAAQFASACAEFDSVVTQAVATLADNACHPHLEAFADYVACVGREYARLKEERGAVDFEDLQLLARDVLRDDPAARAAYRFQRVYVDEAQDVNPLQDELIALLGADAERVLRVGDEQQSIYRFRWADVACFREARARTRTFPLRENYRSQAAVLEPLNDWFRGILAGFAPLTVAVAREPTPAVPVELIVVEDGNQRTTREQEAAEAAAVVRRLHDQERFAWGEIVMLFRARTGIGLYDAALRAVGAPTVLIGGNVFAEHEQVADALALLALVENPHDEEQLVRVLASPYVAASDDDLLALRQAAGTDGALWDAIDLVPAFRTFGAGLRALRTRRAEIPLGGLVEECLRFCDYELAALGLPDGPARYANLRRLVLMADRYSQVRGSDLRGFLRFMQRAVDLGTDPGEAVVVDEELDAVRLMTVHGAKGREFPAVVFADCSNPGGTGGPAVLVSQDGTRVGIRCRPDGLNLCSGFDYRALCDEDSALADEEERRITYVAMTRAKRHLSVIGRAYFRKDGSRAFEGQMGWIAQAPPASVAVRHVGPIDGQVASGAEVPVLVEAGDPPEPIAALPAVDALRGARVSYSSLDASLTEPAEAVAGDAALPGARAFGERFHDAIQHVDWRAPVLGWDDERAQALFGTIRNGEIGLRLAAAGELRTEWPFLLAVDGAIVEGVADVWAREPDGTVLIVDWKTGTLHGPDAPGYALQAEMYALAALRAGAERVDTVWCHVAHDGALVRCSFGPSDAGRLDARVRTAASGRAGAG